MVFVDEIGACPRRLYNNFLRLVPRPAGGPGRAIRRGLRRGLDKMIRRYEHEVMNERILPCSRTVARSSRAGTRRRSSPPRAEGQTTHPAARGRHPAELNRDDCKPDGRPAHRGVRQAAAYIEASLHPHRHPSHGAEDGKRAFTGASGTRRSPACSCVPLRQFSGRASTQTVRAHGSLAISPMHTACFLLEAITVPPQ